MESARPTQLVVMLYDGAIRFLSLAREKMQSGELEERHKYLLKAQRIIAELISSLDRTEAPDIVGNLVRIYTFMMQQLVEANMMDEEAPIESVIGMLRELRSAWVEVDKEQAVKRAMENHIAA